MTAYTELETFPTNSIKTKFSLFDFTKVDGLFLLSEIILKISRHFPIIILSLASLKILLVVNDLVSNNIGFAVLNSLFLIGDFIFLLQFHQRGHANQNQANFYHTRKNGKSIEGIPE